MGFLDSFFGNADQTRALGLLGAQMMAGNTPQGLLSANQFLAEAPEREMARKFKTMQMLDMEQKMQDAQRQREFLQTLPSPTMQASQTALMGGGGPTMANAARIPAVNPMQDLMFRGVQAGAVPFGDYLKSFTPKELPVDKLNPEKFTPASLAKFAQTRNYGDLVPRDKLEQTEGVVWNPYDPTNANRSLPNPNKPFALGPNGQVMPNQAYQSYEMSKARAGAPRTDVRVENKMGESLAGQVGPMVKDSRVQTDGAVKMFDAADRIERALNSNKVVAGPGASQIQTVRQFAQMVGGGNDEGIRQTRQVIKSLAQMAVEARKQLQGQGQVTESEAAAVAKADAGDINDLTVGELRDIVTLTKRAAHYTAKGHAEVLNQLGSNSGTAGLVPFYKVPRMDELLKHEPALPQIGPASKLSPQEQQELEELRKQFGRK